MEQKPVDEKIEKQFFQTRELSNSRVDEKIAQGKKNQIKETLSSMAQDAYKTNAFLILAAVSFVLFLLTKVSVFGFFVALGIIGAVVVETAVGVKEGGWKNEIKEIAIAIAIALIVWYGAGFALSTPSPINAIVSCSMLPQLERGDLVLLQGGEVKAPAISISDEETNALFASPIVYYPDGQITVNGSIYSYCSSQAHTSERICQGFKESPELYTEKRGGFSFTYAKCPRTFANDQRTYAEPCVGSVSYNGNEYATNLQNDVVVYATKPGELYYYSTGGGDIIHRNILTVKSPTRTIYLTKGDNNAIFDIQAYYYDSTVPKITDSGNSPATQPQFKGKVIARIPYLGYPKLFISMFFEEPQGCNMIFTKYKKA